MSMNMSNISVLEREREKITVSFPKTLLADMHKYIPVRKRSQIIVEATARMMEIIKQQKVVEESAGIWKGSHPELNDGVDTYVRRLRDPWQKRELELKLEEK